MAILDPFAHRHRRPHRCPGAGSPHLVRSATGRVGLPYTQSATVPVSSPRSAPASTQPGIVKTQVLSLYRLLPTIHIKPGWPGSGPGTCRSTGSASLAVLAHSTSSRLTVATMLGVSNRVMTAVDVFAVGIMVVASALSMAMRLPACTAERIHNQDTVTTSSSWVAESSPGRYASSEGSSRHTHVSKGMGSPRSRLLPSSTRKSIRMTETAGTLKSPPDESVSGRLYHLQPPLPGATPGRYPRQDPRHPPPMAKRRARKHGFCRFAAYIVKRSAHCQPDPCLCPSRGASVVVEEPEEPRPVVET